MLAPGESANPGMTKPRKHDEPVRRPGRRATQDSPGESVNPGTWVALRAPERRGQATRVRGLTRG
jgi:hypothetical protein